MCAAAALGPWANSGNNGKIINPLKIGNLSSRLPIIQGGMGVGVSLSKLASAVANAGGIGIISGAHPGYLEEDFEHNTLAANIRGLKKHIQLAKAKAPQGIIGVNLMVAINHFAEHVKAAIDAGADFIVSGAGLPLSLPKLTKGSGIKIAPIVSSLKSARVILKMWDKHDQVAPNMVVVEGPKAGGHLGFRLEDIDREKENFDQTIVDIVEEVAHYEEKYQEKIPVIAAGGIYDGQDIAKYLSLGASGVQMGTRFVATHECDAHENFKSAYVECQAQDIAIVKSPVGMPGRAINNSFIKKVGQKKRDFCHCYHCLQPCKPAQTPYCISKALINSIKGDLANGLIFCGENAYRVKEIVSVKTLMNELETGLAAAI